MAGMPQAKEEIGGWSGRESGKTLSPGIAGAIYSHGKIISDLVQFRIKLTVNFKKFPTPPLKGGE
jgi:hypothetical protein